MTEFGRDDGSARPSQPARVAGAVGRRRFLGIAALSVATAGAALYATDALTGSEQTAPRLLWSEEFDRLDLVTPTRPAASWRTHDVDYPIDEGYADLGAGGRQCWMASPGQELRGTTVNPFTVQDSVLTITAMRTPAQIIDEVQGCQWIGGALMTNTARPELNFGYGYYEFRARFPNPGRGMFPALWFYAASRGNPAAQGRAEIDLLEIFGDADGAPWVSTLHEKDSSGNGAVRSVSSRDDDTTQWHTYGLHWTADALRFYRDRDVIKSVTGHDASYYAGCAMSIRLSYSMNATWFAPGNAADGSTPDELSMEVDYIRQYDRPF